LEKEATIAAELNTTDAEAIEKPRKKSRRRKNKKSGRKSSSSSEGNSSDADIESEIEENKGEEFFLIIRFT
jgi:hypothetical protein